MTVLLAMRSPATTTPASSTCSTPRPNSASTPSSSRRFFAALESFSEKDPRTRFPMSTRTFRANAVDAPELRSERIADQNGDRAGHFNSGGTSANQHERQQVAVTAGVFFSFSLFKCISEITMARSPLRGAWLCRFVSAECCGWERRSVPGVRTEVAT